MKTVGLIGGMSWESTQFYYSAINEAVRERLGGLHSAQIILYSVDFAPIEALQKAGDWQAAGRVLSRAAQSLQSAGADFFMICTNTMHKVADQVQQSVDIPMLHIADATGLLLRQDDINQVGLLGTAFTMEQAFYKDHISAGYDIEVVVPEANDRLDIHNIIYSELCLGQVLDSSRQRYLQVIDQLSAKGCQAIILGCTEIGMLVKQSHTRIKLYDTTEIHAQTAVDWLLVE